MVVAVEYISKEESADAETAKHGVTGILAVQGAFAEHAAMLDKLGAQWKLLRAAEDFDDSIDRVILPGGESHHTGQAAALQPVCSQPIAAHIAAGKPVFGTCAGMILLAKRLENDDNVILRRLDATVRRNATVGSSVRSSPRPISVTSRTSARVHPWAFVSDRRGRTPRSRPRLMGVWSVCDRATFSPRPSTPNSPTTPAFTSYF